VHVWAAVGYNFKLKLVFYTVSTNDNSKMFGQAYVDSILELVIKKWLDKGNNFVLEKDSDGGYGHVKFKTNSAWI